MKKNSCFLYLLAIIFTNLCFAQGISTQNLSDKVWENLVQFEESQSPKVLTEEAIDSITRGKWTWFMDAARNIVFTDDIKIENNLILGDPQLSDHIVKNRSIISQDYLREFNVTLPHAYETWDFENDVFSYLNLDFYLNSDNSLLLDIEKEARQYFLNENNQPVVQPDLIEISYT
ncbi:hypothetical protein MRY82_05090, partial [bacterium]|nr:hypothetical protein [bacterium]